MRRGEAQASWGITEDHLTAANALTGGAGDKVVDAVLLDEDAKIVFVTQGKNRQRLWQKTEKWTDVTSFAQLAPVLWGKQDVFDTFCRKVDPRVRDALKQGRERLKRRGYRLQLDYVTLGRCSDSLRDEAAAIAGASDGPSDCRVFDGKAVMRIFTDYLDGVAPATPTLDLPVEASCGSVQRFDPNTRIASWVVSVKCKDVGSLCEQVGLRLFARNIRGFLDETPINTAMRKTLATEPERFWYYNNGITIVCDSAESVRREGREYLHIGNPQIINGQQTTRVLQHHAKEGSRASVLVRVISIPRGEQESTDGFNALVSRIVAATNWQNAILQSDLMSNDRRQVEIERQFRKFGYAYGRKRQSKREARRGAVGPYRFMVQKGELAQAVAACEMDPLVVREGKEGLFDETLYPHVFPTADPIFYLVRYWLMRYVSYEARGYPERAYAKWVALHFVWRRLAPLIRARGKADWFIRRGEKWWPDPLLSCIRVAFTAAVRMYRGRRGKGARAIDVSTFFKRKELHTALERFWRSSNNPSRPSFERSWKRFAALVRDEVE